MEFLIYLVAIVVAYQILTDAMDREVRRALGARRPAPVPQLVDEEDDVVTTFLPAPRRVVHAPRPRAPRMGTRPVSAGG